MLQSNVAALPLWVAYQRLLMTAAALALLIASLLGPARTEASFQSAPPAMMSKVSSVDKALARVVRQLVTRTAKAPTKSPALGRAPSRRTPPALRLP